MKQGNGLGTEPADRGYQRLEAWRKSMDLVEATYQATRNWPQDEKDGLTSQIRRAAVSIPSNIAGGRRRTGPSEYPHHVSIAYGSLNEVETQILIAGRLSYSDAMRIEWLLSQIAEVRRITLGLLRSLRQRSSAKEL